MPGRAGGVGHPGASATLSGAVVVDEGEAIVRRVLVVLLAVLALVAGACSSDGGDGDESTAGTSAGGDAGQDGGQDGGDSEFCDLAVALSELDEDEVSEEEALEALDELIEAAPDAGVRAGLETFREAAAVGEDELSEDQFGELFGAAFVVGAYLEEECGLTDEDSFLGGGGDDPVDGTDDAGDEDDAMSIDSIQAWLEAEHGGEAWLDALATWSVFNDSQVTVGPFSEDLSPEDALAACEGLAAYVFEQAPGGSVTVNDVDGMPVVEAEDGGDCTPVG